jgi:hypothetical protein
VISPNNPIAGQNFKITVDTSPQANVSVTMRVRTKNGKKGFKTLYELVLGGKAKGNGRFGRTRKLDFYPTKPISATVRAVASNAAGSSSKTTYFTIEPLKKTHKKKGHH